LKVHTNKPKTAPAPSAKRYGEVAHVRLTDEEMAHLKAMAEAQSSTVSDIIRRLVRAEIGYLPVADASLRPAIEGAADQLRRVGVNFNQAVRAMNEGRVPYDEDLERALIAVGELVRRFRAELKAMIVRPRRSRKPNL